MAAQALSSSSKNTTLERRSLKRVSFSNAPPVSRGVFLRELISGDEGFSISELKEILKLRADVATSDWGSHPMPLHPIDGPQGQLRHANVLPSGIPHSRALQKRPYPKTVSRIVDESQILTIITRLIDFIKFSKTFTDLKKNISFLVQKKRAINTLRVLYGIDLFKPDIQGIYDIDNVDLENIDIELAKHRETLESYNRYYQEFALQKYSDGSHGGGHRNIQSNNKNKTKKTKKRMNKKSGSKKRQSNTVRK